MKKSHDKFIQRREFLVGDLVHLFNLWLKLFPGKLCSRWSGPFEVKKVYPYGVIEVGFEATSTLKVNASRLKHYLVGEPIAGKVSYRFRCLFFLRFVHRQAHDLKKALLERHPSPSSWFFTQIRGKC